MEKENTEYQNLVMEKYLDEIETDRERGDMISLVISPTQHGYEEEMMEWMLAHPNATFQEAVAQEQKLRPPVVIVDDDEED